MTVSCRLITAYPYVGIVGYFNVFIRKLIADCIQRSPRYRNVAVRGSLITTHPYLRVGSDNNIGRCLFTRYVNVRVNNADDAVFRQLIAVNDNFFIVVFSINNGDRTFKGYLIAIFDIHAGRINKDITL